MVEYTTSVTLFFCVCANLEMCRWPVQGVFLYGTHCILGSLFERESIHAENVLCLFHERWTTLIRCHRIALRDPSSAIIWKQLVLTSLLWAGCSPVFVAHSPASSAALLSEGLICCSNRRVAKIDDTCALYLFIHSCGCLFSLPFSNWKNWSKRP